MHAVCIHCSGTDGVHHVASFLESQLQTSYCYILSHATAFAATQRGAEPEPVSRLAFDPAEEVLWAAGEGSKQLCWEGPLFVKGRDEDSSH